MTARIELICAAELKARFGVVREGKRFVVASIGKDFVPGCCDVVPMYEMASRVSKHLADRIMARCRP